MEGVICAQTFFCTNNCHTERKCYFQKSVCYEPAAISWNTHNSCYISVNQASVWWLKMISLCFRTVLFIGPRYTWGPIYGSGCLSLRQTRPTTLYLCLKWTTIRGAACISDAVCFSCLSLQHILCHSDIKDHPMEINCGPTSSIVSSSSTKSSWWPFPDEEPWAR